MLQRLHFELRYLLKDTPWDSGETPPEVYEFLEEHPPGRAIDLGCGTGTNVITLVEHGWQAVGLDLSRKAVATARRKVRRAGVEARIVHGNAAQALDQEGVEGPFDLALDIGCLHALPTASRERYADQLARLVRPGGTYLLYSFLDVGTEDSARWPEEAGIRQLLSGAFEVGRVEHGHFNERPSAWFTFRRLS